MKDLYPPTPPESRGGKLRAWLNRQPATSNQQPVTSNHILVYALMFAQRNNLDVEEIIRAKMKKNGEKYPVEKSRGSAEKYDRL
jgi:hypothetical protein